MRSAAFFSSVPRVAHTSRCMRCVRSMVGGWRIHRWLAQTPVCGVCVVPKWVARTAGFAVRGFSLSPPCLVSFHAERTERLCGLRVGVGSEDRWFCGPHLLAAMCCGRSSWVAHTSPYLRCVRSGLRTHRRTHDACTIRLPIDRVLPPSDQRTRI